MLRHLFHGLLVLTAAAGAQAGTVAPSKPSDLRTVNGSPVGSDCPGSPGLGAVDIVQNPDGTTSALVIPSKSVLIVTSVDFQDSGSAGDVKQVGLFSANTEGGNALLARCGASVGGNGVAQGSCTLPFGVAVRSGASVCYTPHTANVIVHGFIAKDK
jgi:hypothetical protein